MIFIIRALPHVRKNKRGQRSQQKKEAKEAKQKKRKEAKKKKEGPNKKMREKERTDNATLLFPHLCFKVAP